MSLKKYYCIAKTKLYPLNRSLTGRGVRSTLSIIKKEFPKLKIKKIKAGKKFLIGIFLQNGMLLTLMF